MINCGTTTRRPITISMRVQAAYTIDMNRVQAILLDTCPTSYKLEKGFSELFISMNLTDTSKERKNGPPM